jgi:hypothetical protein
MARDGLKKKWMPALPAIMMLLRIYHLNFYRIASLSHNAQSDSFGKPALDVKGKARLAAFPQAYGSLLKPTELHSPNARSQTMFAFWEWL